MLMFTATEGPGPMPSTSMDTEHNISVWRNGVADADSNSTSTSITAMTTSTSASASTSAKSYYPVLALDIGSGRPSCRSFPSSSNNNNKNNNASTPASTSYSSSSFNPKQANLECSWSTSSLTSEASLVPTEIDIPPINWDDPTEAKDEGLGLGILRILPKAKEVMPSIMEMEVEGGEAGADTNAATNPNLNAESTSTPRNRSWRLRRMDTENQTFTLADDGEAEALGSASATSASASTFTSTTTTSSSVSATQASSASTSASSTASSSSASTTTTATSSSTSSAPTLLPNPIHAPHHRLNHTPPAPSESFPSQAPSPPVSSLSNSSIHLRLKRRGWILIELRWGIFEGFGRSQW
ncbi:hypothetical protein D9758_016420 [Tetrapyrgos nigripes]|uniref:Uncharacterized protein n=1 Tax=Tetrapyrgos nigripes TaxID=182062 RepID=A0A8H5FPD2_9AGAR|nr:hypothetical protein D9758_016420 [Tetrapyrgos nigripes]